MFLSISEGDRNLAVTRQSVNPYAGAMLVNISVKTVARLLGSLHQTMSHCTEYC